MTPVTLVKFPLRILSVLLLRCIAASATSALPTDEHGDYNGADLIAWVGRPKRNDAKHLPSLRQTLLCRWLTRRPPLLRRLLGRIFSNRLRRSSSNSKEEESARGPRRAARGPSVLAPWVYHIWIAPRAESHQKEIAAKVRMEPRMKNWPGFSDFLPRTHEHNLMLPVWDFSPRDARAWFFFSFFLCLHVL